MNFKLISLLLLIVTSLFSLEKVTLQLDWKHQFQYAGFYIAKEKGFYKNLGIEVEIKEIGTSDLVESLKEEKVDFITSSSIIFKDIIKGEELVLLANYMKRIPVALAVKQDIHFPIDLKDKKIMALRKDLDSVIFKKMFESAGITVEDINFHPYTYSLDDFIDGKVDGVQIYLTNDAFELEKKRVKYNILDPNNYGIEFYDLLLLSSKAYLNKNPKLVEQFIQASTKGLEYALNHKKETVSLILEKYNTQNKTREKLLFEANRLENVILRNIYPLGSIEKEQLKKFTKLYEVQGETIVQRLEDAVVDNPTDSFYLTKEEKEYLNKKKVINFCVDPNWMPHEGIDDNGNYQGMGKDYLKLFSQKLNKEFVLVQTDSWKETLKSAKKRQCDVISMARKTKSREEYLDFTEPFVKFPYVIATTTDKFFIEDLSNEENKIFAVVEGYAVNNFLKKSYPNLKIIQVKNIDEGIKKVRKREAFGYIDSIVSLGHKITKEGLADIKVAGSLEYNSELSVATRNDEAELGFIMEKLVKSITDEQKRMIQSQWISVHYEKAIDYELIQKIIVVSLFIIISVLWWNFKISKEKKRTKDALEKLKLAQYELKVLNQSLDKRVKQEIEKNKEQEQLLLFKSRLATMGETISMIAHQWRQPLSIVSSIFNDFNIHFKYGKELSLEEKEELIDKGHRTLKYMSETIDLFQEHLQPIEMEREEKIVCKKAVLDTLELLSPLLKKHEIEVSIDISEEIVLLINRDALVQVVLNIVKNAVDVLTSHKTLEPKITITGQEENQYIILKLLDNGGGISYSPIEKVFEPYTSTKGENGFGIGLFIVRKLVLDVFHGEIEVVNKNLGAEFIIKIPKKC